MSFEEVKLGSICEIARGGSPRPISQFITNDTTGINWIKIGDTNKSSIYLTKTKEKIRPEGIKKSRRVYAGDLILSNSMSFGRPYILKIDGCIHDGWLLIRDNSNKFDKIFLCYLLGSPMVYAKFKNLAVGGVVNNLNSSMVRKLTIPLPPLETQKQIVGLLDRAQALIDKRKEQIALMDQLVQSLFYDMFGDPVTNPMGWEKQLLGDLSTIVRGSSPRPKGDPKYYGGKIPRLMVQDVTRDGNVVFPKIDTLTDEGAKKSRFIKAGTVVMAVSGNVGLASILGVDACIHDGFIAFKNLHKSITVIFFVFMLGLVKITHETRKAGAIFQNLTTTQIKEMAVPIPPIALQNTLVKRVKKIEAQKEAMTASLQELENNFNSIMQRAFKGEL